MNIKPTTLRIKQREMRRKAQAAIASRRAARQLRAAKVSMMQSKSSRIHHAIDWKTTVPCILPERYRKERATP